MVVEEEEIETMVDEEDDVEYNSLIGSLLSVSSVKNLGISKVNAILWKIMPIMLNLTKKKKCCF